MVVCISGFMGNFSNIDITHPIKRFLKMNMKWRVRMCVCYIPHWETCACGACVFGCGAFTQSVIFHV